MLLAHFIWSWKRYCRIILMGLLLLCNPFSSYSQCAANSDFESGTFNRWGCYSGIVSVLNGQNLISLDSLNGPANNVHTIISSWPDPGVDTFGGFPKIAPNGSEYSIQLGDAHTGGFASGLSYDFHIPANSDKFTITYQYAVVMEKPLHALEELARFELEVFDVTDNVRLDCYSFSLISTNTLQGFLQSPVQQTSRTEVWYRPWASNVIRLDGYQGKTVRLFLKAAGCTFSEHFCYVYFDINSGCNEIPNSNYCAGDTAITLRAPAGLQQYQWFDTNFSDSLGNMQAVQLNPPPPAGTIVKVVLTPFPGFGCKDTLSFQIQNSLQLSADAGIDKTICNSNAVRLGGPPVPGFTYVWQPAYGLSNPNISNPMAQPYIDTSYTLTVFSEGGGCSSSDTARVVGRMIDNSIQLSGDSVYCVGSGSPPLLNVHAADSIQWYCDGFPVRDEQQPTITVKKSGTYYALLFDNDCTGAIRTEAISILIDTPRVGIRYPLVEVPFNFPVRLKAQTNDFSERVLWTPNISLDDNRIFSPFFKGLQPQLYMVQLTNENGCITVDTQLVKTYKEIAIYVPTVFTPNGDGLNDYLRPLLFGIQKIKYFRVYNRWGKLIFETVSDIPGWNGKVKGILQNTQTVIWMLEAVDVDGKRHFKKGTSMLIN